MKPNRQNRFCIKLLLATATFFAMSVGAHALTWDTTNAADPTITDGDGAWAVGTPTWNNGSISVNWANGNTADFTGTVGGNILVDGAGVSQTGMTFNGTNDYIVSGGAITGAGGLIKDGTSKVTLTGVNTYTGNTTVHQGTVEVTNINNTSNQLVIADETGKNAAFNITGGTMNINGTGTSILLGSDTGTNTQRGNGTYTQSGGTVTINNNVFLGNSATTNLMTISGGSFAQSAGATYLGIVSGASGTLAISNSSTTVNLNALHLGFFTGSSGAVTISDGTLNVAAFSVIGGSNSGGSGTFTQTGGAVTFATNVNVGNLGNGTVSSSAGTFTQTAGDFFLGVGSGITGTLNVSGTASVSLNRLNLGYQAGSISVTNLDGGTLTIKSLTGGNVFGSVASGTNTINFNGGTLKAGATFNTITGVSTVVKSGGAVIDTNGFNLGMNTALTNGTGGGGLTKKSGGILTLNGANTYTGATDIQGGTLKLAAGSTIADTSTITVGSGAFLDLSDLAASSITLGAQSLNGSGTVSGTVITGANTTIAPGMSPGTLTITGGLNAVAGGTFNFELGATSDSLAIGGVLTGSTNPSDLNFNFSDAGGILTGTTYDLFTFASSSGLEVTDLEALILPAGLTLDPSFGTGGWNITGNNLQVQFIPEPASALLGSLGLLALLRRRRN